MSIIRERCARHVKVRLNFLSGTGQAATDFRNREADPRGLAAKAARPNRFPTGSPDRQASASPVPMVRGTQVPSRRTVVRDTRSHCRVVSRGIHQSVIEIRPSHTNRNWFGSFATGRPRRGFSPASGVCHSEIREMCAQWRRHLGTSDRLRTGFPRICFPSPDAASSAVPTTPRRPRWVTPDTPVPGPRPAM